MLPSSTETPDLLDWLPGLPLQLTAALHHDPQVLVHAMWRLVPGDPTRAVDDTYGADGTAAIELQHYPSEEVIRNLLDISRGGVHTELRFKPVPGVYLDGRPQPLTAAEYYSLQPHEALRSNGYNSTLHILGSTRDPELVALVAQDTGWISNWQKALVSDLRNTWLEKRIGIALVLGKLNQSFAREALRECAKKDTDEVVRRIARGAL